MALAGASNPAMTASHLEQVRRFYQLPVSATLEHRPAIAASLSSSCINPTTSLSSSFFNPTTSSSSSSSSRLCKCRSSGAAAAAGRDLYQPFRRPPVAPPGHGLSVEEQLEILRERRGQWHEHGKVIPNLMRAGYTPSMLDEETGLTGVEQNQIVVASQVRDTLASGGMDEESLAFFDAGGSAVLYELRILSAQQRKSTAEFVIERKMDAKGARDLARAVKDFDRRKRELGWDLFSSAPGDCLAFWWYRQSKEFKDEAEQEAALRKGLEYATTENARSMLKRALGKPAEEPKNEQKRVDLCIVRLELGETAGMVMLPVADSNSQSIKEAPSGGAQGEGGFRIHRSESAWKSWVPLPGWQPILDAVSPITVLFPDSRIISSQEEKNAAKEEEMLLVAEKGKLDEIKPSSMYLVDSADGGLRLQSGAEVSKGEALAEVLMALWPPRPVKEAEDEMDWD